VTLDSKEIKPAALAIIELRLSEGIYQPADQPASQPASRSASQ